MSVRGRRLMLRGTAVLLAAAVAATAGPILLLRWVPPPTSAFMMHRRVAAWTGADTPTSIRYRWVAWDEIAPAMRLAVVASEDQKFPSHGGFDTEAIAEALRDRELGGRVRGASTISQQTAKNIALWPDRSWVRKGLEVYYTVLIETLWPKRRILEVYLNLAEFGDGIYGVGAAAEVFFATTPARLTARQAAQLATVLPAPRRMRPDQPGPWAEMRADWVLRQMRQLGDEYLATGGVDP
jgi:monofunctional biosynthetic peptidoglycan transglycosylase